jgi:hypothetical protein
LPMPTPENRPACRMICKRVKQQPRACVVDPNHLGR